MLDYKHSTVETDPLRAEIEYEKCGCPDEVFAK